MTNKELKLDLIEALRSRGEYFRKENGNEYRVRCPYCGDSSNPNTGHFYLKIDLETDDAVLYNCFKCDAAGVLGEDELAMLDISDVNLKSGISTLNKDAAKRDKKGILESDIPLNFPYVCPPVKLPNPKVEYLEKRLGIQFTDQMVKDCKIITSLKHFLQYNKIETITSNEYIIRMLDRDYVGFLSAGASHILFRDITRVWRDVKTGGFYKRRGEHYLMFRESGECSGKIFTENDIRLLLQAGRIFPDGEHKVRWFKYPICEDSRRNKIFYTTATEIDVTSTEPITINMAEGVLDVLSAMYNLGFDGPNTLNISPGGNQFARTIAYITDLGLIGSNIKVNVFADNDQMFNPDAKTKSTLEDYERLFRDCKNIFGGITVHYNGIGKDIGVQRDKIRLISHPL